MVDMLHLGLYPGHGAPCQASCNKNGMFPGSYRQRDESRQFGVTLPVKCGNFQYAVIQDLALS